MNVAHARKFQNESNLSEMSQQIDYHRCRSEELSKYVDSSEVLQSLKLALSTKHTAAWIMLTELKAVLEFSINLESTLHQSNEDHA